jgi:hypothetical protein
METLEIRTNGHFPHRLISQNLSRRRDCFLLKRKIQRKKNNTSHLNFFLKYDEEDWPVIIG